MFIDYYISSLKPSATRLRRLCFYACLSVILFTGISDTVHTGIPSPLGTRHPPCADSAGTRYTPGSRHSPPPPGRRLPLRTVRILLECILVFFMKLSKSFIFPLHRVYSGYITSIFELSNLLTFLSSTNKRYLHYIKCIRVFVCCPRWCLKISWQEEAQIVSWGVSWSHIYNGLKNCLITLLWTFWEFLVDIICDVKNWPHEVSITSFFW